MPTLSPPSYPTPFVGRVNEQQDIIARLLSADCRLLTLTGLGGSGKTRLAAEVMRSVGSSFADGAIFVPLQSIPRGDLLLSAIAQAVGLTLYGEDEVHEQLFAYLRDQRLLLVLDNFEHLSDAAGVVSLLLAAAPDLTILATSRQALRLQEEWLYPLPGLAAPLSVYTTALEAYDAVQLFLAHARRVQPGFDLAAEHDAVVRICMLTAGLPLALELATSWLKGMQATHVAQAMQRSLDVLSTTTRNAESRHRSMRAVFDQSWDFLTEADRLIFARLAVFRGSFAPEAAQQVAGASFTGLATLVETSLVQLEGTDRFRLHELLRQYAMEQLETLGLAEATAAAHSDYFAAFLQRHELGLKSDQQLSAMAAIERDFDNVRAAWEWAVAQRRLAALDRMAHGLYLFGFLGRRHVETLTMFQATLAEPIADEALLGRLLVRRWGSLHWWLQDASDYSAALAGIERALGIAQRHSATFEIAFCHLMAAYALMGLGRSAAALPQLETSKALFEALDEPYYVCWVLSRLGYLYAALNDPDKEIETTEQSLALARAMQNRFAMFSCLYNLGSDYLLNGDYVTGREYGAEALRFANDTGQLCQISHAASLLALQAFYQGDYQTCRRQSDYSLDVIRDILLLVVQPYSLALLILLACLREDYAEAIRINDLSRQHSVNAMGSQLNSWALAAMACGLGRLAEARAAIQSALARTPTSIHPATTMWVAPCAAVTLASSDPHAAVRLLAWVLSSKDPALDWAQQWPLVGRLRARLAETLEPANFTAEWTAGTSLTLERLASLLHAEFRAPSEAHPDAHQHYLLTAREREILRLIASGKTNPQIAEQLIIGAGTVKTHTLNIYRKLEVANRTQAIVRAQEWGLLSA